MRHHQVDVDRTVGDPPKRADHRRAEGDVGDEIPVHDVHVHPLGAAGDRRLDLVAQAGQVGAEHAGRDDRVHGVLARVRSTRPPPGMRTPGAGALVEHGAVADAGPLGVSHIPHAQPRRGQAVRRLLTGQALQRRHLNIGRAAAHDQRHRVARAPDHPEAGPAGEHGARRAQGRDRIDPLDREAGLEHDRPGQVHLQVHDVGHRHGVGPGADRKMHDRRRREPRLRRRVLPDHDAAHRGRVGHLFLAADPEARRPAAWPPPR